MFSHSRIKKERIAFLLSKRITEGLTADETRELELYCQEEPALARLISRLENRKYIKQNIRFRRRAGKGKDVKKFLASIREGSAPQKRNPVVVRWVGIGVAAVLTFAIVKVGAPWHSQTGTPQTKQGRELSMISPDSARVTLTLADGEKISLDRMDKGQFLTRGNWAITKVGSNHLLCQVAVGLPKETAVQTAPGYNTLETSKGGPYNITLPDGTQVWLNEKSTLRLPTDFSGNTREVDIIGEAYFDVAKNVHQPFKVHHTRAGIPLDLDVLGTSFNISAYPDDPNIRTTLITGAVRINQNGRTQLLAPNEQLIAGKNGEWQPLKNVQGDATIAWKDGKFDFSGKNLSEVMQEIGRKYDKEIVITGRPSDKEFTGVFYQSMPLDDLLREMSGPKKIFQYRRDGNKIYISQ